jgi:hypothetical protein
LHDDAASEGFRPGSAGLLRRRSISEENGAVRGRQQTNGRTRNRAGLAFAVLLAVATLPGFATAREDGESGLISAPYVLAADRVSYWEDGDARWVLLDGRAAVLQGVDGVRGDQAVVRITGIVIEDKKVNRLDIYLEGHAQFTTGDDVPRAWRRLTRATEKGIEIRPYLNRTPTHVTHAPRAGVVSRAFPVTPAPKADEGQSAAKSEEPAPADRRTLEPTSIVQPAPVVNAPPLSVDPVRAANSAPQPNVDPAPVDPAVRRVQFGQEGFADPPFAAPNQDPAPADMPGVVESPNTPLLESPDRPNLLPPSELPPQPDDIVNALPNAPVLPSSRRFFNINPRDSGSNFKISSTKDEKGETTIVVRGGVSIQAEVPGRGTIDVSADSAVIWMRENPNDPNERLPTGGGAGEQSDSAPLEAYLEGNVLILQDKRKLAGNADQTRVEAPKAYFDFRTEYMNSVDAEVGFFAPSLLSPLKARGRTVRQYRPVLGRGPKGEILYGPKQIRAEHSVFTGSRFPIPGYRFNSLSVDLTEKTQPLTDPNTGKTIGSPKDPAAPKEDVWHIDSRQNLYFIGPFPVFYWPKVEMDSDDIDPTLRSIQFRANNYFGQQLLLDFNMFKVLNIPRPRWVDVWNFDVDYLSARGLALGSEIGWFGKDLFGDVTDPYDKVKDGSNVDRPYYGYLDLWGLHDMGKDVLGPGPAIVTNGPEGAGKAGFQRTSDPPFQNPRERITFRHMQSLLPSDAPLDEDFRIQVEAGYVSDRNFLEEYYKRLFDTGFDQETLAYGVYQRENRAFTVLTEGNLQNWYTESQWLPKVDYFRIGDSFFDNFFNYSTNTGIDYANTHTAIEVNNPRIFAFLPFDPVSNTRGVLNTGRAYTSHELDMPLNFDFIRIVPYLQGQLVGWNNQLGGNQIGRAWGAFGGRLDIMAWKNYPEIENELLNIHGVSHKINFDVDFRSAYSNVHLNRIGVQDDLDNNTYEYVRRYFTLTNYVGGILPAQYDPRLLTLRRVISPITGTTDIQDTIETVQFGIRQRLQTKRGPEGKRRIIDFMTLDLTTTYFPNASRDNFGKPFGQNQYNWEWFIGDRTSLLSYGWFEFFNITGKPILLSNPRHSNDPLGLNVITSGISINRPPRGNIFIGYSVINTGPIATSALNTSFSYWLSPKWYGSFATSYDFGNAILLGSTFAVTKIGADFLYSVGLSVDPQRQAYTFGFELSPRLSPSLRFGSGGGAARFDPRFAPTQ